MPNVLVVDDESQIRDLLVRWISSEEYQVREADSAAAALDGLQITPADVVLCDVNMPGGENGVWLTGQIRSRYPETAVVLATSDLSVPPQVSMQPGVVEYLAKPFTRGSVLKAVRLAAEWHAAAVSKRGQPKVSSPQSAEWIDPSEE